jgi:hypothetical protein
MPILSKEVADKFLQKLSRLPHNDDEYNDTLGSLFFLIEQLIEELTIRQGPSNNDQDNIRRTGMELEFKGSGQLQPRVKEIEASLDWELIKKLLEMNFIVLLDCFAPKPGEDVQVKYCGSIDSKYISQDNKTIYELIKQVNVYRTHWVCAIWSKPPESTLNDELGY